MQMLPFQFYIFQGSDFISKAGSKQLTLSNNVLVANYSLLAVQLLQTLFP